MFQVNPLRSHRKNQALFSSKDKSRKLKFRLLQFLSSALRINGNKILFCTELWLYNEKKYGRVMEKFTTQ